MPLKILSFVSAVFFLLILSSCDISFKKLFSKQTAREKYLSQLKKKSPRHSAAWADIGEFALKHPLKINVPYAEAGYFSGEFTDAVAFRFSVKAGQAVSIKLKKTGKTAFTTFLDLWDAGDSAALKLLQSSDTTLNELTNNSTRDKEYIFRMQPAVADSGRFELHITISPILEFPIAANTKSNIGSFWGSDRDGGGRRHEGIDIFAKKGSEVVAVADGYIGRTGENNLGGKVVWLRPAGHHFSVYYAHLDSQLVKPGQKVNAGQPIGWVGNTGNAKHTPPHLHFGIYTSKGAVNPLAFVQKVPPAEQPAVKTLNEQFLANSKTTFYSLPARNSGFAIKKPDTLRTEAFTGDYYRIILTDSTRAFASPASLSTRMKL